MRLRPATRSASERAGSAAVDDSNAQLVRESSSTTWPRRPSAPPDQTATGLEQRPPEQSPRPVPADAADVLPLTHPVPGLGHELVEQRPVGGGTRAPQTGGRRSAGG